MIRNMATRPKPVVLCVLDGWGHRTDPTDNAIARAETPVYDRLMTTCPRAFLRTSETDVGLPAGQMGNSEVGHLNLGAGRVVNQEIRRIDAAIADGSLATNPALTGLIDGLKETGGACHLMGLLSPGGVHSHQDHIAALARILSDAGVPVSVHAFLDGRDMPPASALACMDDFLTQISSLGEVSVATVSGRYYAMDRDNRWERVERAYAAVVSGAAENATDPRSAIRESYDRDTTDEFVVPVVIGDYAGMNDGDAVLMANFRADRAREILSALLDPEFDGFERGGAVQFSRAVGMVSYSERHDTLMNALFPPISLANIFAELVAGAGMTQLRIAETEKYAHVTFFFNGGEERAFEGEDRILVPSPKVATYDLKPEMSAVEVTDRLVEAVGSDKYDFIFVNYANPDMVGHTGVMNAAVTAIETVDRCLGRLEAAVKEAGGALLITADHGNAETMRDAETGEPHTAHTLNDVPILLVNGPDGVATLSDGRLADVAPTMLQLLDLPQPHEMTGTSLLTSKTSDTAGDDAERSHATA